MGSHALLSASSSKRWLNCPPSARLSDNYEDKVSDFAAEGTDAHSLCEFRLKESLGLATENPIPNLAWYSEEMESCANDYVSYITEQIVVAKETCSDPIILIEQRLDYSRYVESGFGTGDCVIVSDSLLHVVDYKHGQGVLVEAERNPQMMLYALGALELFDGIYDIQTISMTVYQPRRSNISTYTIPKQELLDWANEVLVPAAKLAFNGDGEFHCGEWCLFCKAKAECRERAEVNMQLARDDFKLPPLLEDDEVEEILSKIDELISWANDIKAYALQTAMGGKEWSGYKLVEGRSNRKYTNENAVASVVQFAGFDPYEKKLLGITEMQKTLGKAKFEELLSDFICKPQGKPTLVPTSDKRSAINISKTASAVNDFKKDN